MKTVAKMPSRASIDGLLAACRKHYPEVYAATLLAVDGGLRLSEISSLVWENVYIAARDIDIPDFKGEFRRIPLTPDMRKALGALSPQRTGLVFKSSPEELIAQLKLAASLSGQTYLSFGALRYEYMHDFLRSGCPEKVLAYRLGQIVPAEILRMYGVDNNSQA